MINTTTPEEKSSGAYSITVSTKGADAFRQVALAEAILRGIQGVADGLHWFGEAFPVDIHVQDGEGNEFTERIEDIAERCRLNGWTHNMLGAVDRMAEKHSGQYEGLLEVLRDFNAGEFSVTGVDLLGEEVVALQRKLGVAVDGHFGPGTIKAWQKKLGVAVDGFFGPGSATAARKALAAGRLW